MIDPIIETRFKELPPSYQSFVASDFPSDIAEAFALSLKLTSTQIDIFENGLILYLLFFFTQAELVEYIVENTGADLAETTGVISVICKHLPEFANNEVYEQARLEVTEGSSSLNLEIAETENALRSIEGLRTMAGDASAVTSPSETTYQSTQAEILSQPQVQPVAPPPPTPNTDNRWDSAS